MYHISLYFDEKTNKIIQQYINLIAKKSGNTYMLDNQVPPHITLSAFDTQNALFIAPPLFGEVNLRLRHIYL